MTESEIELAKKEKLYVFILTALQFVHILDFVIMMPLGPTFMREFDIGPAEFALLVSSYTFSAGIVGFIVGPIADNFERKSFMLLLFSGFLFGTFICAIAPDHMIMILGRVIAGGFGGVVSAVVLSIAAELIPIQRRGKALGVIMSSFSIASVLGVPTGLFIANTINWHASFVFIMVLGFIFLLLSILYLPKIPINKNKITVSFIIKKINRIFSNKDYVLGLLSVMLISLGSFTIIPFIAPYTVQNVGLKETDLPLIYLVGGAFTIFSARLIGKLSDQYGNYRLLIISGSIALIPMMLLTQLPPSTLVVTLMVSTFFMMFVSGRFVPLMTMVSNIVTNEDRGTFMNYLNALRQFGSGIASYIAGLIIIEKNHLLYNYDKVGYLAVAISILSYFVAYFVSLKDEQVKSSLKSG